MAAPERRQSLGEFMQGGAEGVAGSGEDAAEPESKPIRFRHFIESGNEAPVVSPYLPIAEDLEWLRDQWLLAPTTLTNAELRRGSATLRRLLNEDTIHRAWHHHGLSGAPTVFAPDLVALAKITGVEPRLAASLVAGGAVVDHAHTSMIGAFRVDNPTTGVKADADKGFAVLVGSIVRDTRGPSEANELALLVAKEWRLSAYLSSPGAVRRGQTISRKTIIEYFAHYAGGVHLGRAVANANLEKRALYDLVGELGQHLVCDKFEGLYFELLSIGQALARSPSLQRLVVAIRQNAALPPAQSTAHKAAD